MHTNNDLNYLVGFKIKIFSIFEKLNMKYKEITDQYLLSYLSSLVSKRHTRI